MSLDPNLPGGGKGGTIPPAPEPQKSSDRVNVEYNIRGNTTVQVHSTIYNFNLTQSPDPDMTALNAILNNIYDRQSGGYQATGPPQTPSQQGPPPCTDSMGIQGGPDRGTSNPDPHNRQHHHRGLQGNPNVSSRVRTDVIQDEQQFNAGLSTNSEIRIQLPQTAGTSLGITESRYRTHSQLSSPISRAERSTNSDGLSPPPYISPTAHRLTVDEVYDLHRGPFEEMMRESMERLLGGLTKEQYLDRIFTRLGHPPKSP